VGVPAICPVPAAKLKPPGRAGVMVQLVAAPPVLTGLIVATAAPSVQTTLPGL